MYPPDFSPESIGIPRQTLAPRLVAGRKEIRRRGCFIQRRESSRRTLEFRLDRKLRTGSTPWDRSHVQSTSLSGAHGNSVRSSMHLLFTQARVALELVSFLFAISVRSLGSRRHPQLLRPPIQLSKEAPAATLLHEFKGGLRERLGDVRKVSRARRALVETRRRSEFFRKISRYRFRNLPDARAGVRVNSGKSELQFPVSGRQPEARTSRKPRQIRISKFVALRNEVISRA